MKRIIAAIFAMLASIASCEKVADSGSDVPPTEPTAYSEASDVSDVTSDETETTGIVTSEAETSTSATSSTTVTSVQTTEQTATEPPAIPAEFSLFSDYTAWASNTGYPGGMLTADGMSGINGDYFHTLPGTAGYSSGRIVIGDSRCCQLGIYQYRSGRSDFATFAVWGGHYISGSGGIMTEAHFADVQACFEEQVQNTGKCDIYLFATVNDFDFLNNANSGYISAAVNTARRLAGMTCESNGNSVQPQVYVIGFDGCWTTSDLYGTPQETFNRYVPDYNSSLNAAVAADSILSGNAAAFTTVPEIAGGKAEFIDDGLHYADSTLAAICSHIIKS